MTIRLMVEDIMPLKDPEARRQYAREWYSRPANRERVKAAVRAHKRLKKINSAHDARMANPLPLPVTVRSV